MAGKFKVEEATRVSIKSGFYEGHNGEVISKVGNQWRVQLDAHQKLALVDEADIVQYIEPDAPAEPEEPAE